MIILKLTKSSTVISNCRRLRLPTKSLLLLLLALVILIMHETQAAANKRAKNILNEQLEPCNANLTTGFFRDGYCNTDELDHGTHVVCAVVTDKFLNFTKSHGNDLITPVANARFPGLKAGDSWCLCILRWKQAYQAGIAPPIKIKSTHKKALEYVSKATLKQFKID